MSARPGARVERQARLRWLPLGQMRVNPLAQRDLKPSRVSDLAADMDLEQLGTPTCSLRDGAVWVIDGHHRIEALKAWLGDGWETQTIQCWTYEGLTEAGEAEIFLRLNNVLAVSALDKFRIAVKAGRPEECGIDRIVRSQGLVISRDRRPGTIRAVGALRAVYRRSPSDLARVLRIISAAYSAPGFEGPVIEGFGLLCHRYNGDIDDAAAAAKLGRSLGGLKTLLNSAELLRQKTGSPRAHCIAAAAVEILNRGRGGKKLSAWWKTEEDPA